MLSVAGACHVLGRHTLSFGRKEVVMSSGAAVVSPAGTQDTSDLVSPSKRSSQKYVIEGLTEKSSQITDPWERLFKILNVVGVRCEWQMDKGRR